MYHHLKPKFFILFFLCLHFFFNVSFAGEDKSQTTSSTGKNPLTVKDSLIRYWNQKISNNLPKPSFLISKASPLTAVDAAFLVKLADQNALSNHLPFFCSSANMACFTDLSLSLKESTGEDNNRNYMDRQKPTGDKVYVYGEDNNRNYMDRQKPTGDKVYVYGEDNNRNYMDRQKPIREDYYRGRGRGRGCFLCNYMDRQKPTGDGLYAGYGKKATGDKVYVYGEKATGDVTADGKPVNTWVEPGIFFRESNMKQGTIMTMPDFRDKMPKRSFLPRSLSSKLPFSTSKLSQLKQIFHASDNSNIENILKQTVELCERAPSQGETKKCVGSIEDMIDFAVSILGSNVVVRSMEGVKGSKKDVMLGVVKGINGGKTTKSVSCHQSLYPYLVYYCHSLPKVRVYEVEILDVKTKEKINKGTAICHVDTSAWNPGHLSFVALGSSPGKIEVCHWIFEATMTWATTD